MAAKAVWRGLRPHAAPFHSCKYRWLPAPATSFIWTKRSPVSGDLLLSLAALSIPATSPFNVIVRRRGLPRGPDRLVTSTNSCSFAHARISTSGAPATRSARKRHEAYGSSVAREPPANASDGIVSSHISLSASPTLLVPRRSHALRHSATVVPTLAERPDPLQGRRHTDDDDCPAERPGRIPEMRHS